MNGSSSFNTVEVHGTVNLGGSAPNLLGPLSPEFDITPAMQLVIIDNDGSDPVIGTFGGLPNGSTIIGGPGGLNYTIAYNGGTGNDVVLTATATTAIPALEPRALAALAALLAALALIALRR